MDVSQAVLSAPTALPGTGTPTPRPERPQNLYSRRKRYGAIIDLDLSLDLTPASQPSMSHTPSTSSISTLSPNSLFTGQSTNSANCSPASSPGLDGCFCAVSVSDFPLPPTEPSPGIVGNTTLDDLRAQNAFWRSFGREEGGRLADDDDLGGEGRYDSLLAALAKEPSVQAANNLDFSWEAEGSCEDSGCSNVVEVLRDLDTSDSGILDAVAEMSTSSLYSTSDTSDAPLLRELPMDVPATLPRTRAPRRPVPFLPAPNEDISRFSWVSSEGGSSTSDSTRSSPTKQTFSKCTLLSSLPNDVPKLVPAKSMPDLKSKARQLRRKTSSLLANVGRRPVAPPPPLPTRATSRHAKGGSGLGGKKDLRRVLGSPDVGVPPMPLRISHPVQIPVGLDDDASFLEASSALDRLEMSITMLDEQVGSGMVSLNPRPCQFSSPFSASTNAPVAAAEYPTSTLPAGQISKQKSLHLAATMPLPPPQHQTPRAGSLVGARAVPLTTIRPQAGHHSSPDSLAAHYAYRDYLLPKPILKESAGAAPRHVDIFKRAARRAGMIGRWNKTSD